MFFKFINKKKDKKKEKKKEILRCTSPSSHVCDFLMFTLMLTFFDMPIPSWWQYVAFIVIVNVCYTIGFICSNNVTDVPGIGKLVNSSPEWFANSAIKNEPLVVKYIWYYLPLEKWSSLKHWDIAKVKKIPHGRKE